MSGIVLSVLLMLSPEQPPAAGPAAASEAPAAQPAEQKMVCRDEYETGSRIKRKIKVCRPVTEADKDATTANLQRQLDKSAALGQGINGNGND